MNAGRAAVDHDGSHDEGDGDDADSSAAPGVGGYGSTRNGGATHG